MKFYESLEDGELADRFSKGDEKAFAEIYSRHWLSLYKIALKYTSSAVESEEMVQVLFEKIWKNREKINMTNSGAYLAISLRNLYLDSVRANEQATKFKLNYQHCVIDAFQDNRLEFKELVNEIEGVLKKLPSKTQTVFRLSRFEGKSVKEIAAFIGLTDKAVEYHITKAIKELRESLHSIQVFFKIF
ncbi:MAG TPA: sigma-70 family RNA polymerase sigma factor [Chitinophagaceae bacterium]|jgi:RNA polymerase sigma-70 factor (ECF subfamily)|nr:sigma-70 family RNA polymerase sigma factor [Chitinophagaceae bacterium]